MRFRWRRLVVEVRVRVSRLPDYPPPHFLGPLKRIVFGWDPTAGGELVQMPPHGEPYAVNQYPPGTKLIAAPTTTTEDAAIPDPLLQADRRLTEIARLRDEDYVFQESTTTNHCRICGIGVTVLYHHTVAMCGHCYQALGGLPTVGVVETGDTARHFVFGEGVTAVTIPVSLAFLTALDRTKIAPHLAESYKQAIAAAPTGTP